MKSTERHWCPSPEKMRLAAAYRTWELLWECFVTNRRFALVRLSRDTRIGIPDGFDWDQFGTDCAEMLER